MNEKRNRTWKGINRPQEGPITSSSAGRVRLRSFSSWPIALRVVLATVALSSLSILIVGAFLSNAISGSLSDRRIERSVAQTEFSRELLLEELESMQGRQASEIQQTLVRFTEQRYGGDPAVFKGIAIYPVNNDSEIGIVTTDQALASWTKSEFSKELSAKGENVQYVNVELLNNGVSEPALLTGAQLEVKGVGTYKMLMLFSVEQEQETINDVNVILIASGVALSSLFLLVSLAVSRIVTVPLRRAARAAESMSKNNLDVRLQIQGGDDLSRVGTSFNNMAASLQSTISELLELSEVQKRFVSDVSHELRTPLTTMKIATSILNSEKESFSESASRSMALLSEQMNRFETLLADLLEISRHDAGGAELDARQDSLESVVQRTIVDLQPIIDERGVQLRVTHHSTNTSGYFDSRRIQRIIRNLLTNAIEHGAGGVVLVETARRSKSLCLIVQDFGVGLSPAEAAHVFDRFWRADSSRVRTLGGTGLGLAISKEDAELHGGRLDVWGVKGKTAVFRLLLPSSAGEPLGAAPLALDRYQHPPEFG